MHTSTYLVVDDDRARDLIELGVTRRPDCRRCGAPTSVVEHDDGLWLECTAIRRPSHPLLRLLDGVIGPTHDRELLIDGEAA
jgi:hypothetical protein